MGLFGKKSGGSGRAGKGRSARSVLDEACGRNIPVCVVRPREAGRVPMARGRLLNLSEDGIDIDRVQVPGRDVRFSSGDDLEAYFSMGETLYQFRTKLLRVSEPKQLNAKKLIMGMTLSVPGALRTGDRRNVYRVSVSAREDRPSLAVWRLPIPEGDTEDSDLPGMPAQAFNVHGIDIASVINRFDDEPDHRGWLVDATDSGLGIRLESVTAGRFSVFEPLLVQLSMPKSAVEEAGDGIALSTLDFLAEVRTKRAVGEDGCRLGIVLMDEGTGAIARRKRTVLRKYLAMVQREHLRNHTRAA